MKTFIIRYLSVLKKHLNQDIMILTRQSINLLLFLKIIFYAICFYGNLNNVILILLDIAFCVVVVLHNKYYLNHQDIFRYICEHRLGLGKYAADMYFTGYLRKILPMSEIKNQSEIAERIKDFENKEKIQIPVKKLFILFPRSGKTEPQIGKHSDLQMIEVRKNLNNLGLNRSGVKDRMYTNTVYKVFRDRDKTSHVSIVAEFASPLTTLTEICKMYPDTSQDHKHRVINVFCDRVEELLNDNPESNKYCELIRYNDDIYDNAVFALQKRLNEILPTSNIVRKEKTQIDYERSLENDTESPSSDKKDFLKNRM